MSVYLPSGQVIEMTLSGFGTCHQCGSEVADGAKISYWHSGVGKSYDRIITCPACARPKALLQERIWLMEQLDRLRMVGPMAQKQMSPMEIAGATAYYSSELDGNYHRINTVLMKLIHKLPKCEECTEYATQQIRNGPFLCEGHTAEHPTAQEVEWAQEIRDLGLGSSFKS